MGTHSKSSKSMDKGVKWMAWVALTVCAHIKVHSWTLERANSAGI